MHFSALEPCALQKVLNRLKLKLKLYRKYKTDISFDLDFNLCILYFQIFLISSSCDISAEQMESEASLEEPLSSV